MRIIEEEQLDFDDVLIQRADGRCHEIRIQAREADVPVCRRIHGIQLYPPAADGLPSVQNRK